MQFESNPYYLFFKFERIVDAAADGKFIFFCKDTLVNLFFILKLLSLVFYSLAAQLEVNFWVAANLWILVKLIIYFSVFCYTGLVLTTYPIGFSDFICIYALLLKYFFRGSMLTIFPIY